MTMTANNNAIEAALLRIEYHIYNNRYFDPENSAIDRHTVRAERLWSDIASAYQNGRNTYKVIFEDRADCRMDDIEITICADDMTAAKRIAAKLCPPEMDVTVTDAANKDESYCKEYTGGGNGWTPWKWTPSWHLG